MLRQQGVGGRQVLDTLFTVVYVAQHCRFRLVLLQKCVCVVSVLLCVQTHRWCLGVQGGQATHPDCTLLVQRCKVQRSPARV
jgi:hypothetical protein